MQERKIAWLLAMALLPFGAQARGHACWVDHVHKAADGVVIQFDAGLRLRFRVLQVASGERRQYYIDHGNGFVQDPETGALGAETPVMLKMGETGFAFMRIEDSCTFTLDRKDGVLGAVLENAYGDPDGQRHDDKEFVPAD